MITFMRKHCYLPVAAATLGSMILLDGSAWCDSRQEAIDAVTRLYQAGCAQRHPEEMRSLDAALATAESLHQGQDAAAAERHHLMALQKARILETAQCAPAAAPMTPLASEPPPSGPAGAVQTTADSTVEAAAEDETIDEDISSAWLVGRPSSYTVVKGDTLRIVAAKLGVSRQHLMTLNGLTAKSMLKIGQELKYNNRKIVPQRMREGIVVNIPDRTLYFFRKGKLVRSLPVALGTSTKNEKYDWQTPTGKFRITAKQKDPTWYVPPSIQSEMEEAGKEVIISIPPGPDNPLGKFAIKTSLPGIMIHSTTKPWSIYSFASHGCIRVYPDHMEEFFQEVKVNTPGEIIYKPVKLAVTENGRVFLEVHRDVYNRNVELASEARRLVERARIGDRIDWRKFNAVVRQKSGLAEDITL